LFYLLGGWVVALDSTTGWVVPLTAAAGVGRQRLGGKAATLAALTAVGFAVPAGFVVTTDAFTPEGLRTGLESVLETESAALGALLAVRSSAVAEDLAGASHAGLYETYLNVAPVGVAKAVRRCWASAHAARVSAYRYSPAGGAPVGAMAVLVQSMITPVAAGVAFTANPVTGARQETVVTAVPGLAQPLVAGQTDGQEWIVRGATASCTRAGGGVLDTDQAKAIAALAGAVQDRLGGPQDIEWALAQDGKLWLLQARPMTALPDPVHWRPPSPGYWMRSFRLGEWLPEAMTPLFADWLLPALEAGYLAGMRATVGVAVPFRRATINGWYYTAPPALSPIPLVGTLLTGRRRLLRVLGNALIRAGRNPVAADRAVLAGLAQQWRAQLLPAYQAAVADAAGRVGRAEPAELGQIVDQLAALAGRYLWSLTIVGGSAWKMEAALARFYRRHLAGRVKGNPQTLLSALPGVDASTPPHAVHSVDWFHCTAGELNWTAGAGPADTRRRELTAHREVLHAACRDALRATPRLAVRFSELLEVTQRYTALREQQAREFTLAWPVLRRCALRLGDQLHNRAVLADAADVFFLTRAELTTMDDLRPLVDQRRARWDQQRRLMAPLTIGTPHKLAERAVTAAVAAARTQADIPPGAIVGHPASPGRATGPVRIITDPADFPAFHHGDVLVARATSPAWTPLFAHAAALVTDAGTLAAHASLIAREYGIPAVVGTGNATTRLHPGQQVTVNGSTGMIHRDRPVRTARRARPCLDPGRGADGRLHPGGGPAS
jgi:phosphohistidine swiveling domain-containing protein